MSLRFLKDKKAFLCLILFVLLSNLFLWFFLSQQRDINTILGFWLKFREAGEMIARGDFPVFVGKLAHSMQYEEYNSLFLVPLLPFYFLTGPGNLSFVAALSNVYVLLAALTFAVLFGKILEKTQSASRIPLLVPLLFFFLWPLLWYSVLEGIVDVGGLFLMNIVLILTIDEPVYAMRMRKLAGIGIALGLLMLFRRWYAYWVVGYFVAASLDLLFAAVSKKTDARAFAAGVGRIALILASFIAVLLVLSWHQTMTILGTNYSDVYSAYKLHTNLLQEFRTMELNISRLYVLVFFVSCLVCFLSPVLRQFRRFFVFLSVQIVVFFFAYEKVQTLANEQHYYVFFPVILVFIAAASAALLGNAGYGRQKAALVLVSVVLLGHFSLSFVPATAPISMAVSGGRSKKWYPVVRSDIDEIRRLNAFMDETLGLDDRYIVLGASKNNLRLILIQYAYLSLGAPKGKAATQAMGFSSIDKRDGFSANLFKADYVVIGDPVQYEITPESGRIMGTIANDILDGTGIGAAYDRLPQEFLLRNDTKVYVFKRTRPFLKRDIDRLLATFKEWYPDYPKAYTVGIPPEAYEPR